MAKRVDEVIIEVEVNAGESAEKLTEVKNRLYALKAEQKAINKEIKESGTVTNEQAKRLAVISGEIKTLTQEEKLYTSQLNTATQGDKEFGASLQSLSIQLAKMKAEYRGMSEEMRKSDAGEKLKRQITDLDKTMKDADGTLGDFQRKVGNYQSALLGLNGNVLKISQLFAGGFKQGVAAASTALKSFFKTIVASPIGVFVAAIGLVTAAFGKLKEAFQKSDEAGTALSVALSKMQPIITGIGKAFEWLAEKCAAIVGAMATAATAVLRLVPSFREAQDAAADLIKAEDRLQDKQREYVEASAERYKEIARLKKEERANEELTFQERERIFQKIDELERKDLEERVAIAKENARIIEERYKQEVNTSDAAKDRIAAARAEVLKAETEYLAGTTRIAARASAARKQEAKEAEEQARKQKEAADKAREAWRKAREEREKALAVQREEVRRLEDLTTAAIEDELERQRVAVRQSYERRIEDLKRRLETEKSLTIDAREAINGQVVKLQEAMWKELAAVDSEELKKAKDRVQQAAEEAARRAEDAARAAADATEAERTRIRADYEKHALEVANDFQERLNAVYGNAAEAAELELKRVQEYHESLKDMTADTYIALFGSEEAYKNAVLQAEAEILAAREKSAEALQAQAKEVAATMQAFTGALSDLYEAAAGDSVAFENFKKAIALVDAAISLAQAIAAATSASTAGDPYTMAIRIAANVAAVTAQFAAVVKAIKEAQVPNAPKFEKGGIVTGDSYTGDRVNIRVNSGEMILTREQQARLFEMIQAGVPRVSLDYGMMAAAMSEAVEKMPSPVLEYREFSAFERKINFEKTRIKEL